MQYLYTGASSYPDRLTQHMIITTDSQKNTYSSYHIAKAFFPNEEIETRIEENGEDPRSLYLRLRKETGRDLPWGMLTGVRPTKLAMGKVKEQMPLGSL